MPDQRTLRDCCVNTDDGLSFRSGDGICTNCIGKRSLNMQLIVIARCFGWHLFTCRYNINFSTLYALNMCINRTFPLQFMDSPLWSIV